MFPDIGGSELIIVAIVALLVVKPKDLPVMMRKIGEFTAKARRMANDFRASFEDMARQSELDDLRKEVEAMRAKAADPVGVVSAMRDATHDIQASFAEPAASLDAGFDYSAPTEAQDTTTSFEPSPKPKARRAAAAKSSAGAASAKPRKSNKSIVEGGPKSATSATVSPASRKRAASTAAKKAT